MPTLTGQSDVEHVRDATDLVALIGEHVALRPKGREFLGLCPFHDDRNPSLAVVIHKGNAFYKCHACGASGDCFNFVMEYHKRSFSEALQYLAERAGIQLRPRGRTGQTGDGAGRQGLREANALAADFYQQTLHHPIAGQVARQIIQTRRISEDMVKAFGIGVAPDQWDGLTNLIARRGLDSAPFVSAGLLRPRKTGDGLYDVFRNRIIFPICDDLGHPIAFGGRQIDPKDDPKYLNSSESPLFHKSNALFAIHLAKRAILESRQAIVVEGYVDAIACHQAGVVNVVATLGTALTASHANVLSRLCETVILVFDGDEAGQKAANRGVEVFFNVPVDVKICVLPRGLDPDDLLKEPDGRAQFDLALAAAMDALAFKVRRFRSQMHDAASATSQAVRLQGFLSELADLGFNNLQGVRKRLVLTELADLLRLPVRELERAMPAGRSSPPRVSDQTVNEAASAVEPSPASMFNDSTGSVTRVVPARQKAEHWLLSILIFDPTVHARSTPDAADAPVNLLDRHSPEDFLDPQARALADIVFGLLRKGESFTVPQLMSAVADPQLRGLIATLYEDGRRRCGEDESQIAGILRSASDDLLRQMRRESFHQSLATGRPDGGSTARLSLDQIIQKKREHGHDPAAMPRGVRS